MKSAIAVRSSIPRPEFPRPDRDRSFCWLPLNGIWSFQADELTTSITVPFAWETDASGIGMTWLEDARYSREVTVPADWQDRRTVVCFGAVHYSCQIYIDDVLVATHVGGYESFEVDVTHMVRPGMSYILRVDVQAPVDKRAVPHGKQRSVPRDDYDGVCFTPTSGIWQSVWLEGRGQTYVKALALRGDDLHSIRISAQLCGVDTAGCEVTATVVETGESIMMTSDHEGRVTGQVVLAQPCVWSPADPFLYHVEVSTGADGKADRVVATVGLRRVEIDGRHILLNGRRLFVRGVLDQGYWPGHGMTAPSVDALRTDLRLARDLGFNLVRKHLKLEDPMWLHEADALGMLVWEEPPCPSRFSDAAVAAFEAQIPSMVERDGSHPSVIIWGLYNEEWGLDWDICGSQRRRDAAIHAYKTLKSLDGTRPIVENSGWSHVHSDLLDWHYYEPDPARWADRIQGLIDGSSNDFPVRLGPDFIVDKHVVAYGKSSLLGRPNLNSEYGEGMTSLDRAWHLRWQTQELRRHDGLSGYVYTELTDIEHEMAGLLDAWRRPKDWMGLRATNVHSDTVLVIDLLPSAPGADIPTPVVGMTLNVHVSHHGDEEVAGRIGCSWARYGTATDVVDVRAGDVMWGPEIAVTPYRLSGACALVVPDRQQPGRLMVWFEDERGAVRARSFIDAAPVEAPNRRGARPGEFVGWPVPGEL